MRILVFQHLAVEHPGIFCKFWKAAGDSWHTVELDEGYPIPPLDDFDLLVVMGGPMDVWQEGQHPWLVPEKAAILHWVKTMQRPYLGICLGHQLLGDALGGEVSLMASSEVGLANVHLTEAGQTDPLLVGFGPTVETFQWHSAEVSRLPQHTSVLAANANCPVQAMRWGKHAYGFQYHVEITPSTVREWGAIPEYRASLEAVLGTHDAQKLDAVVAERLATFNQAAQRIRENLTALVKRP